MLMLVKLFVEPPLSEDQVGVPEQCPAEVCVRSRGLVWVLWSASWVWPSPDCTVPCRVAERGLCGWQSQ